MRLTFLEIINTVTIVQLLIFSLFLFTIKKGNTNSFRWLAIFFIVQSTCIINSFLRRFHDYTIKSVPYLFFWAESILFLWGPCIYMYVKQLTSKSNITFNKLLIHFMPFLLHVSLVTIKFHLLPQSEKIRLLLNNHVFSYSESVIITSAFNILVAIYLILSIIEVNKSRNTLKNSVSESEKISFKWLFIFLYGFLIIWLCDLTYFITGFFKQPSDVLIKYAYVYIFCTANFVVFFTLKQPSLFHTPIEKRKYSNSYLTGFLKEKIKEQLLDFMEINKPYLNSSLTVNELADKLAVHPKYLSQIINECFNQNFFDFINSYRIKEAKQILSNGTDKRNVLQILYDVGFNSKSAFNKAFLKYTNLSPTEFKRQKAVINQN